jgi:hypothetical protein
MNFTRRSFISRSATALAAATMLKPGLLRGADYVAPKTRIGFQSWIVKDSIEKDFAGTLKMVAGLGYNSVEMCSPPGYAKSGFGALVNLKAGEMKKSLQMPAYPALAAIIILVNSRSTHRNVSTMPRPGASSK